MIYKLLLYLVSAFIFLGTTYLYLENTDLGYNQFSEQTASFLQGRTDIPKNEDTVDINEKHYWHQPPLPSLFLLPFQIIFGRGFNEFWGIFTLIPILVLFLYKLIRSKKINTESSIYLITAFLFGSVMGNIILNPVSWYLSQIVATTLLTILLYEFETKRRYFILGLLLACLVATRITAATIGIFLIIVLFQNYRGINFLKTSKQLLLLTIPVLVCVIFLLGFNYLRFGNPLFDTYKNSTTNPRLIPAKEKGIFSIEHIPSNVYYAFLTSVTPVTQKDSPNLVFPYITYGRWGLSFFLICPFFIYAIKSFRRKDFLIQGYWLTICITLFIFMTYYGFSGFMSFGPRYFADFLPILFLLVLYGLNTKLTPFQKNLILISACFNTYLLLSPHLVN